jgi:molybdopterin-guanine dinucleotide biosynthesis protein B
VLVEGFKHSDLFKIEIWREPGEGEAPRPARYAEDAHIVAIATDTPELLPTATELPVFDLNDVDGIGDWLLQNAARFEYKVERHG